MAKKITKQQIAKARAAGTPTTGDGWSTRQKPSLADTNLGGSASSGVRVPWYLRIGRHHKG